VRRALGAAALLALAGCAGAPPEAPEPAAAAATPPPGGPQSASVRLAAPGSIARARVERLAVVCWLDDELAAEVMVVDRQTGDIVAADGSGELLRVAFAPSGALETEVRLAGPALADPGRRARMTDALGRALEGPEPAC
jgi:hypothetical protein